MRTILVVVIALAASLSPAHAEPAPLHPAMTGAERALDRLLHRVDADPRALSNLVGRRGRATVDYRPWLTPALRTALAQAERAAVQRNCGGRYRSGEICGLDFVPVGCAQDNPPAYVFRTVEETAGSARIDSAWIDSAWNTGPGDPVAAYTMVRRQGGWQLDGVACAGGSRFNR